MARTKLLFDEMMMMMMMTMTMTMAMMIDDDDDDDDICSILSQHAYIIKTPCYSIYDTRRKPRTEKKVQMKDRSLGNLFVFLNARTYQRSDKYQPYDD